MKKLSLIFLMSVISLGTLGASFSALVVIQDPQKEKPPAGAWDFQVQVRDLGGDWEFRLKVPPGNQKPFLLIASAEDKKIKLDFRDVLWDHKRKMDLVCPLVENSGQVVFRLGKDLVPRASLVVDYPSLILDGGIYYTVDLASFVD